MSRVAYTQIYLKKRRMRDGGIFVVIFIFFIKSVPSNITIKSNNKHVCDGGLVYIFVAL